LTPAVRHATLWIQLLCNPATLLPVLLGGTAGGATVFTRPPLRTATVLAAVFTASHLTDTDKRT